jgi:hypothetical protein
VRLGLHLNVFIADSNCYNGDNRNLGDGLAKHKLFTNMLGLLTGIATPSRVYLIDTGNEGLAQGGRARTDFSLAWLEAA